MEKPTGILYAKQINLLMIYCSVLSFMLFIGLTIETVINAKPIGYSIGFLLFTLLSVNAFRVSRKRYKQVKKPTPNR